MKYGIGGPGPFRSGANLGAHEARVATNGGLVVGKKTFGVTGPGAVSYTHLTLPTIYSV